jgi:RimJ/RimL family protein N-acetyltransferase
VIESDLPIFFEHQRDPEGARMAAFTPRNREAFVAHWTTKVLGAETGIVKTVLVDGKVAGNVMSFEHAGRREVGYWIGREFWGRGVATAALKRFLDYDRTRPLYAGVVTHNVGSIRVLEKCGFSKVEVEEEAAPPGSHDDGLEEVLLKLD